MKPEWDNLFSYEPGNTREGQREGNTTKNLLKVLQDTNTKILIEFLEESFSSNDWPNTAQIDEGSIEIRREVQLKDWDIEDHDRFLLGIARRTVTEESKPNDETKNRIDGTISFAAENKEYAIGIEIKTHQAYLGENQLRRYASSIFGDGESLDSLSSKGKISEIDWWTVFHVFQRSLEKNLATDQRLPIYDQNKVGNLGKDDYLLNEFLDYLDREQLEDSIAEAGDDYIKRLRMFRYRKSNGRWPKGELMANLTWEKEDGTKISKVGPQPARNFEHLLWQIGRNRQARDAEFDEQCKSGSEQDPRVHLKQTMTQDEREIRKKIFCAPNTESGVDFGELVDWADDIQTIKRNGSANKIASTQMDDGDFSQSQKYRKLYLQGDSDVPNLKLKHYSENNNPSPQTPPILSEEEFNSLFGGIGDSNIREELFVEPDMEKLWEYRLQGKI